MAELHSRKNQEVVKLQMSLKKVFQKKYHTFKEVGLYAKREYRSIKNI